MSQNMNQKQYNEFRQDLAQVYNKYGFDPKTLPVQGQRKVEEIIKNREPHKYYHPATYGSKDIFDEFQRTGNLKLVWARMSSRVREYQLDPVEVAEIAPDYCPANGLLLDYGYGNNRITENTYFRPGIDHIIAVGNGGAKYGDITNIQIVSQHFNTIKNMGTSIDAIKWVGFELKPLIGDQNGSY